MPDIMMTARRSACVAPEVNVRNNSVQALKRARECTVALKTSEDVSKSPKQGYQWPPQTIYQIRTNRQRGITTCVK